MFPREARSNVLRYVVLIRYVKFLDMRKRINGKSRFVNIMKVFCKNTFIMFFVDYKFTISFPKKCRRVYKILNLKNVCLNMV